MVSWRVNSSSVEECQWLASPARYCFDCTPHSTVREVATLARGNPLVCEITALGSQVARDFIYLLIYLFII